MSLSSSPPPNETPPSTKTVRFEPSLDNASEAELLPTSEEAVQAREAKLRRADFLRRKRRQEPTYDPSAVYGFYVPDPFLYKLGLQMTSPARREKIGELSITFKGIRFAASHIKGLFPEIPLRWRHTPVADVLIGGDLLATGILPLGHVNANNKRIIDVTEEEIEHIRMVLELGDQKPQWYPVVAVQRY